MVILYYRVSTDEQRDSGNSIPNQKNVLRAFCQLKNYHILQEYEEDCSAKTFDRPEWKKLLKYVAANKKTVEKVLILRWDRFARNAKDAINEIDKFTKMGIAIDSVEQPLDMSIPENKLLLHIYLTIPEIENIKNSQRTTECSRTARIAGCWTGTAPFGYSNSRNFNGKSTLTANDKAALVIESFSTVAKNTQPVDAIRKSMNKKGVKLNKQAFLNMLRNVVYTGKIYVKEWKKEDAQVIPGLHDGIITDELFRTVQNVLAGKKIKQASHKEDENFPLRGHLLCPVCNSPLTGGASKGRSQYYNYYKCQHNCISNIKAEDANAEFVNYLRQIKISPEVSELYMSIMEDVFKKNEGDKSVKVAQLKKRLESNDAGFGKINDDFIKGNIDSVAYNKLTNHLHVEKAQLQLEIDDVKEGDNNLLNYTRFALPFLTNLDWYYENSTLHAKRFIAGSIFPEKLYYSENSYRTAKLNEVLALISNTDVVFSEMKNKKATKNRGLSSMAPPSGLEPETL